MELQQHIGHPHPLVLNEETSNQSEESFWCSGCDEEVLGPSFSCATAECEFYFFLHKECAEAPMQIQHHPFHRAHPLILRLPSSHEEKKTADCEVCFESTGKGFSYHCSSCKIAFHINCSLPLCDTAGNFIETLHLAHEHPLLLIHNHNNLLKNRYCFGCSSPLADASYVCFNCKIFFHKKCVELPIEISHPCHRKHQLLLEFATTNRLCNLCQTEHAGGLFYRCSICDLNFHSKCSWPPAVFEDKSRHEHPFTLVLRPNSFTCDACGTQGNNVYYICSTCNIQVHKDCISLPRIIRINLHRHPIAHSFFFCVHRHDSKTNWNCRICYKKVNTEHGSYHCSKPDCDFTIHVKCAIGNKDLYGLIELENQEEIEEFDFLPDEYRDLIFGVIREIKVGEDAVAPEIIHDHNLTFSNEIKDNIHCNGCVLPIFSSFYYCSRCDFFLHKACAELPSKTRLWFNANPFFLLTNHFFICDICLYKCYGFAYKLDLGAEVCLRCASLSHGFTYQAQEPHFLFFDNNCERPCSACGSDRSVFFRCKDCDFALDFRCVNLPRTVWHKCDKHSLTLTYGDYNDYPQQHYCDICEERRDPKHWFYHCEVCDNAAHPKCVLGEYPGFKLGSKYTYKNHPHPLTFVQKIYYYPLCVKCGEPCQDLTLECLEQDCNHVIHWTCTPFWY